MTGKATGTSRWPAIENTEHISEGVSLEWYAHRQIVAYVISDASADEVTKWSAVALKTITAWPAGQPYLALHDLTAKGVALPYLMRVNYEMFNAGVTPEGHSAVQSSLAQHPEFSGRVAIVFNRAFSGKLGQVFARSQDLRKARTFPFRYNAFMTREQALDWLLGKGVEETDAHNVNTPS